MERKITIIASNGEKFEGTDYQKVLNTVISYEKELDKQDAERKAREEKQKQLKQFKEQRLKEINQALNTTSILINDYEKEYGTKLHIALDLNTDKMSVQESKYPFESWDNTIRDIFKLIRKY
jgi:predicted transglutaminase-like cysteine proteinase